MNLSILHISDLHRFQNNPIQNSVLLDSLENDCHHYCFEEDTRVRKPDLIVVSGDIIQGIEPDILEPEECLNEQYREALEFLAQLSDHFIFGDRERVIIVPGNHDISACHFHKSLERVDVLPDRKKELINELFTPESLLRWSWSELELYKIADSNMYERRMAAFAEFYSSFYNGERTYDLDPAKQIDFFDYPAFELTIVGFSSCYNNDLFNRQGAIHPECIANAGNKLRHPSYANRLLVAVWHHNTEGSPTHSDYMDPDLVQNLINRGFSLGLHGHQHRPQFLDTRFRHGMERKITVISAGTLCGGPDFRHGRAYNVIELNTSDRVGRLHVREMQNDNLSLPIWGRRALSPNIGPFYEFRFEPPFLPTTLNTTTTTLVDAQELYSVGDYRQAAELLVTVIQSEKLARPLLLDCLVKLQDTQTLIEIFDPPEGAAEAIHVMDALWAEGMREPLSEFINQPCVAESVDPSVCELKNKYSARLN